MLRLDLPSHPQDLEDAYQDAASNVLVAICKHSWQAVVQLLETQLLTGVFPHRSVLYVMGMLSSAGASCRSQPRHSSRNSGAVGHRLPPRTTSLNCPSPALTAVSRQGQYGRGDSSGRARLPCQPGHVPQAATLSWLGRRGQQLPALSVPSPTCAWLYGLPWAPGKGVAIPEGFLGEAASCLRTLDSRSL